VAEFRDHILQDDEIMDDHILQDDEINTIVCCTIKTVGSHLEVLHHISDSL
jgi:hypothetical protein